MIQKNLDIVKLKGDAFSVAPNIILKDKPVKAIGNLDIFIWKGAVGDHLDRHIVGENLVVTIARRMMSRLISGALSGATIDTIGGPVSITNPDQLFITNMRWGTGGHNPGNPTEPLTPSTSDEDLASPIVSPASKPVTIDYPTDTSVSFTAELGQSEANGQGLSEEGLFSDVDFMFARKTFGLLTKTADFSFSFKHTLLF